MAFARLIVDDTSSAVTDQIRRTVNTLVLMLGNMGASITAGATAAQVMSVISDGIIAGADTNPNAVANVTVTNREIVCIQPMTNVPKRPGGVGQLKVADVNNKNL